MSHTQPVLRIGHLASAAGLTVDAVRYYERVGLLKPVSRTEGGFRNYSRDSVDRLAFIRQAQRLGLHLREIRDLLAASATGSQQCQRVRGVLGKRLADVEVQMAELRAFRKTLRTALSDCDTALRGGHQNDCPVVGSLTNGKRPRPPR